MPLLVLSPTIRNAGAPGNFSAVVSPHISVLVGDNPLILSAIIQRRPVGFEYS